MSKNYRRPQHAGTWYSNDRTVLDGQLSRWLGKAKVKNFPARAIIAPHAGYTYCGECGGNAYKQIDPSKVKRVFILGPAHYISIKGCALSTTQYYQTPLYNLNIDTKVYEELYALGSFESVTLSSDEDEHSIEMHLPYIAKVMEDYKDQFTIVPVMVGSLSPEREMQYGRIFSQYLADPDNLFVISSDFCHWGNRFNFQYYNKQSGHIWQSIEHLDRMGMGIIESLDPLAFTQYLKDYGNTICGRHPIGVLLNAINILRNSVNNGHKKTMTMKFLEYAQSNRVKKMEDSSVSYAAAALTIQ
ncbi:protein MEMO1-like [Tubulanus polymorphus]|uniref:protein MEMO1-like n=1 Tax=Tubulanus polymorphus TaxID=672921 RepID=UPI003DA4BFA9